MDTDKIKIFGARIRVEGTGKLEELERAEREKMRAKVEKIKDHGITCFVNRQLIYNWPEQLFADAGIMSIEHADFDGVERLALVTGGEITSTFDHPELVRLGHCDVIEEVIIGEDKVKESCHQDSFDCPNALPIKTLTFLPPSSSLSLSHPFFMLPS